MEKLKILVVDDEERMGKRLSIFSSERRILHLLFWM